MPKFQFKEPIPEYLKPYIATQDPLLYTPMDHASWRYILNISRSFFTRYAHKKYLDGLKETGISTEYIPLISDMDRCLSHFGWQAVPVTGFIPPAVFMEFLSLGVLPIACDMRTLDHLAYTPAPDIVHEAAGHAPIIADPEYAAYLRSYGEISKKAIYSLEDMKVYNAIRHLSIVKENPLSSVEEIQEAQASLDRAGAGVTYISEATLLSRMGWWTFEYGLVGELTDPKIYGAGLLSSLGESYHFNDPSVNKVPFSLDCIHMSYDITRPQPQLFVAPNFNILKNTLIELAETMAFKKGGNEGLEKALKACTTTTTVLDSGIQISGTLSNVLKTESGKPCYLQFKGPTQISFQDLEIQSALYHKEGFGTPLVSLTEGDLETAGFKPGRKGKIEFPSGITLEGRKVDVIKKNGRLVLITFEDCEVKNGSDFLFRPEWGTFDMVCGEEIVSVFGGAADRKKYLDAIGGFHQSPGQQKTNLTEKNRELNELYRNVRNLRERKDWDQQALSELTRIYEKLENQYPEDWLLRYELLELNILYSLNLPWICNLQRQMKEIASQHSETAEMVRRGLELLERTSNAS